MVGGNAIWNLKIKGNFSPRGDKGTVNSSPITTIAPVIKLLRTCNSVITIPGTRTAKILHVCTVTLENLML